MRHALRRPAGDSGMTLAEMLVGVVISSFVMAAAATVFTVGLRSNTRTTAQVDNINDARVAVMAMTRSLRTAVLPSQLEDSTNTDTAFLSGTANSVSFYANIDNPNNTLGPSRVSYVVTGGNLVQTVQLPKQPIPANRDYEYCALTSPTCARRTTVLARGVTTTQPIFTYHDQLGKLTPTANCSGTPCLKAADLANVFAVDLQLVLRPPSGTGIGPTSFLTRVALPNRDSIQRDDDS